MPMLESDRHFEFVDYANTKAIVMAGGKGKRLESVTGAMIPKDFVYLDRFRGVRAIDYLHSTLQELNLNNVIYSANHYYSQYQKELHTTPYELRYQEEGDNHGTDLRKIIDEEGSEYQYLILPTDTYFSGNDIRKLLSSHQPGSVTWAVSAYNENLTEDYRALFVGNRYNEVIGKRNSLWWKGQCDNDFTIYSSSAIMIWDGEVYKKSYDLFSRFCKKTSGVDMYIDVAHMLAERNRRRIERGKTSLINAHVFTDSLIDFGIPERLELTRALFEDYEEQ